MDLSNNFGDPSDSTMGSVGTQTRQTETSRETEVLPSDNDAKLSPPPPTPISKPELAQSPLSFNGSTPTNPTIATPEFATQRPSDADVIVQNDSIAIPGSQSTQAAQSGKLSVSSQATETSTPPTNPTSGTRDDPQDGVLSIPPRSTAIHSPENSTNNSLEDDLPENRKSINGTPVERVWKKYMEIYVYLTATTILFIFTAWYSFKATSTNTLAIFDKPAVTILILNLLSTGLTWLWSELCHDCDDMVRWRAVSSTKGISALNFFGLSNCLSNPAAFRMLFCRPRKISNRGWIFIRLVLVLIRSGLGIILLVDVDVKSTYIPTTPGSTIIAGLGTFNASLAPPFYSALPLDFLLNIDGILGDSGRVSSVSSSRSECSNTSVECWSGKLPGGIDSVIPDPVQSSLNTNGGNTYIVESAPGYEVDFFPLEGGNLTVDIAADCRVYASLLVAFQICVRGIDNDLMIGWTTCRTAGLIDNNCLRQSQIQSGSLNGIMRLHISSVNMTSGYDLFDLSIQYAEPVVSANPLQIPAADIFSIFDIIFDTSNDTISGSQVLLIEYLNSMISTYSQRGRRMPKEYDAIRALFVLSLVYVNNVYLGFPNSTADFKSRVTTGYFARSRLQIVINPRIHKAFTVLGCVVLAWCLLLTIWCSASSVVAPNSTDFPEIDFAARVIKSEELVELLDGLGNASTQRVERECMAKTLYLTAMEIEDDDSTQRLVLATKAGNTKLELRSSYL